MNGWPREAWTEVSRQFESGLVLHLSPAKCFCLVGLFRSQRVRIDLIFVACEQVKQLHIDEELFPPEGLLAQQID